MIDIGVARPSAQGQAMMSTDTAATSASPNAGAGPQIIQAAKARTARGDHGRDEPSGDRHRRGVEWVRGCAEPPRPCGRCGTVACRYRLCSAVIVSAPVPLRVPPITCGARRLLDRHRFAGHHRFIDCARSLGHRAVDRHRFTRPHPQSIAYVDRSMGTSSSVPSIARRRAVLGASARSARMAPPVFSRARSSSTWPSSTRTVITAAAS